MLHSFVRSFVRSFIHLLIHYISFRNGTAIGGSPDAEDNSPWDFEQIEDGSLTFQHGETSKMIVIRINPESQVWVAYRLELHRCDPDSIPARVICELSLFVVLFFLIPRWFFSGFFGFPRSLIKSESAQ